MRRHHSRFTKYYYRTPHITVSHCTSWTAYTVLYSTTVLCGAVWWYPGCARWHSMTHPKYNIWCCDSARQGVTYLWCLCHCMALCSATQPIRGLLMKYTEFLCHASFRYKLLSLRIQVHFLNFFIFLSCIFNQNSRCFSAYFSICCIYNHVEMLNFHPSCSAVISTSVSWNFSSKTKQECHLHGKTNRSSNFMSCNSLI